MSVPSSLREVETQLLIAERLGYVDNGQLSGLLNLVAETGRVINGLMKSLDQPHEQKAAYCQLSTLKEEL